MKEITLGDVVASLEKRYPLVTAQSWDSVGLVAGDPADPVSKVLFAMDPVSTVVDEALEWGADLIVTHHPLFLKGVNSVAANTAKGSVIHRLIKGGCALYTAHTNADAARRGVNDALADLVGLENRQPLVPRSAFAIDKHVVFVPTQPAGLITEIVDAMAAAGAGEIGDYSHCHWSVTGMGSFFPTEGANPTIGDVGAKETVSEYRLEMVAPSHRRQAVISAMQSVHPYEEPAFDIYPLASLPGPEGLGRVGTLKEPISLEALANRIADVLPATAQGVRVSGDRDEMVQRVAVCSGSGDSLFDQVRRADVDVYLTSDLRHHPASEARETALMGANRPFLIDVAHFASEWPWLVYGAEDLATDFENTEQEFQVRISSHRTDPWDFRVASHE